MQADDMTLTDIKNLLAEVAREQVELTRQQKKTDRQLRELGQQIGGLGNKFGSFTEGMALPSMQKILQRRFGMEVISPSVRIHRAGKAWEIDVLAYADGVVNTAIVVEVKSHLREEGIEQLLEILHAFPQLFPEHAGKKVHGMLAAVDIPDALRAKVLQQGLYLAHIHDEMFELQTPAEFVPVDFGAAGTGSPAE